MNYEIRIPSLNLDFTVPPSKSVVHRELIIKFLMGSFDRLRNPAMPVVPELVEGPQPNDNDDIRATRACLKALSEAVGDDSTTDIIMPCNESGSTLRFMISVGAAYLTHMGLAGKKRLVFLPKGRLVERPLEQLVKCLGDHGVTVSIDKQNQKIYVEGELKGGVFKIEGNVSSQYASGLQMASLVIPGATVEILGPMESKGYYDLTLDIIKKNTGILAALREPQGPHNADPEPFAAQLLGDSLKTVHRTVFAPLRSAAPYVEGAEGDWSSAAFLLTLGALTPDAHVELSGLNKDSFQKDKIILEILKKLGFEYEWKDGKLCLVKGRADNDDFFLSELELDAADYPDIVPYIAVVAAARCKHTIIKNIERLRFKECDRVMATIEALKAAGAKACEKDGTLVVEGGFNPSECIEIPTFNDHRMAMTACLVAAWTKQAVMIDNKECVNKSFPGLWSII